MRSAPCRNSCTAAVPASSDEVSKGRIWLWVALGGLGLRTSCTTINALLYTSFQSLRQWIPLGEPCGSASNQSCSTGNTTCKLHAPKLSVGDSST